MAQQLLSPSLPPNQKQMAALVIKNSVVGPSARRTEELAVQWLALPSNQRDAIKHLVRPPPVPRGVAYSLSFNTQLVQGLSVPHNEARLGASQVVAQIGVIELCNQQWPALITNLVSSMSKGSPLLQEGTLNALGIICEEIVSPFVVLRSTSHSFPA